MTSRCKTQTNKQTTRVMVTMHNDDGNTNGAPLATFCQCPKASWNMFLRIVQLCTVLVTGDFSGWISNWKIKIVRRKGKQEGSGVEKVKSSSDLLKGHGQNVTRV